MDLVCLACILSSTINPKIVPFVITLVFGILQTGLAITVIIGKRRKQYYAITIGLITVVYAIVRILILI